MESQLSLLDAINTPRFHHFQNLAEIELYIFTGASSLAYVTGAYYRVISNFGIKVLFIIAKSYLAPLKENSLIIPKLELQLVIIASRVKVKILDETKLNIKSIYFWTN